MAYTITMGNHKGGTGKTATTVSLGAALAQKGKRVLLVDADPQGNLSTCLGIKDYEHDISDLMMASIEDKPPAADIIARHEEGMDIMPANLNLAPMDTTLAHVMNRERILYYGLEPYQKQYDYILIDSAPGLGLMTINALAAANGIIIPVQTEYLAAQGMSQIMGTIHRLKRGINSNLRIDGVLMTMSDTRTNMAKETIALVKGTYGSKINIFKTAIPRTVSLADCTAAGKSIIQYEPSSKAAAAYMDMAKEVMSIGKKKTRNEPAYTR